MPHKSHIVLRSISLKQRQLQIALIFSAGLPLLHCGSSEENPTDDSLTGGGSAPISSGGRSGTGGRDSSTGGSPSAGGTSTGGEPGEGGGASDGGTGGAPLFIEPLPDADSIAGVLTSKSYGAEPFLSPASIDEILEGSFSLGREFFVGDWVPAPNATRPTLDGLGPLFHATSCMNCHPTDTRPASLLSNGNVSFGLLIRLGRELEGGGFEAGDPIFGGQFQPSAVARVPAEGTVTWSALPGRPAGVSELSPRPLFTLDPNPSYGALHESTRPGPRLSPLLVGMGLLEHVPEEDILAWEDPQDRDGDGIKGRAARLVTSEGTRIGRFGWKAIHPSLRSQTTGAFVGDLGITSPDHPTDDCTTAQSVCLQEPDGGSPEISGEGVDAVDEFMSYLAVPAARRVDADPEMLEGNELFHEVGCASCHRPRLRTQAVHRFPPLAHQTFYPYTDLLLHDMGEALSDAVGEGDAKPREWRTAPLWGLGLLTGKSNVRYLHDGRAASLIDAILWHGGEAERSRDAFYALDEEQKQVLLAFLRSL